jgi:hypothetical protein
MRVGGRGDGTGGGSVIRKYSVKKYRNLGSISLMRRVWPGSPNLLRIQEAISGENSFSRVTADKRSAGRRVGATRSVIYVYALRPRRPIARRKIRKMRILGRLSK